MEPKSFAQQNQFDYLYSAITAKYPGLKLEDGSTAFQFMEMPMEADWVTGTDEKAFNLADVVPAKLGGFYSTGTSRVSVAYKSLLESLMGAMADNNSKYRELQSKMETQANLLRAATEEAKRGYGKWRTEQQSLGNQPRLSLMEWMEKELDARVYKKEFDRVSEEYDRYAEEAKSLYGAMGAALEMAKKLVDTDQMLVEADIRGGKYVPRTTIGGNLQQDIRGWKGKSGEYDLDVIIRNQEQKITPWRTVSSTEVKQTCHSTKIESQVDVSRIIMDKSYQLRVKAVGLRGYPITRGSWFNDAFVRPDAELPEGCQLDTDAFFGDQGSLHLIPTSILVLYRPEIELTVSTTCYNDTFGNKTFLDIKYLDLFNLRFDLQASLNLGKRVGDSTVTQTFVAPENTPAQILGISSLIRYSGFQGW